MKPSWYWLITGIGLCVVAVSGVRLFHKVFYPPRIWTEQLNKRLSSGYYFDKNNNPSWNSSPSSRRFAAPLIQQRNNQLTVDLADDLGKIYSDRIKLQHILYNLLSNTGKFTQDGPIEMPGKPGAGSSFTVRLPIDKEKSTAHSTA